MEKKNKVLIKFFFKMHKNLINGGQWIGDYWFAIYNVTIKLQMAFDYDMWVCPTI